MMYVAILRGAQKVRAPQDDVRKGFVNPAR